MGLGTFRSLVESPLFPSQPTDQAPVSCVPALVGEFFTTGVAWDAHIPRALGYKKGTQLYFVPDGSGDVDL